MLVIVIPRTCFQNTYLFQMISTNFGINKQLMQNKNIITIVKC